MYDLPLRNDQPLSLADNDDDDDEGDSSSGSNGRGHRNIETNPFDPHSRHVDLHNLTLLNRHRTDSDSSQSHHYDAPPSSLLFQPQTQGRYFSRGTLSTVDSAPPSSPPRAPIAPLRNYFAPSGDSQIAGIAAVGTALPPQYTPQIQPSAVQADNTQQPDESGLRTRRRIKTIKLSKFGNFSVRQNVPAQVLAGARYLSGEEFNTRRYTAVACATV
eukprot:jgi/Hompol1/1452/HPOL_000958-RA